MKITKEGLKVRFDEYNQLYFGSVLPRCEFSVCPLNCLGQDTSHREKRQTQVSHQ